MSNMNRETILRMISEGKITAEEGMQLLDALDARNPPDRSAAPVAGKSAFDTPAARPGQGKFLRVIVKIDGEGDADADIDVDINLPLKIANRIAPMLEQVIPVNAQIQLGEIGFDMATLVAILESLDEDMEGRDLVNATIKGKDGGNDADIRVRIYVE